MRNIFFSRNIVYNQLMYFYSLQSNQIYRKYKSISKNKKSIEEKILIFFILVKFELKFLKIKFSYNLSFINLPSISKAFK